MVMGIITLIGSGEFSGTMVETHKRLLSRCEGAGKAIFLDTPAGFQENVDLISQRAADYFEKRVGHSMKIASFKSSAIQDTAESDCAYRLLNEAGFVLIGPGSPTYTVRQLKESPIPAFFNAMVARGGSLVMASAAALTAGSHTLPVYEIYKVGEELHWVEGLNILGHLGLEMVVIPHWNNAEGGNHDTRFCYMGKRRFRALEAQLPQDTIILGIDEHTACILDFSVGEAQVEGIGRVTVRRGGKEKYFERHDRITFKQLLCRLPGQAVGSVQKTFQQSITRPLSAADEEAEKSFRERMHIIETAFQKALEEKNLLKMMSLLLEADNILWQTVLKLENPEFVNKGRDVYREMIALAGTGIEQPRTVNRCNHTILVNALIELREEYRRKKKWEEADKIRNILQDAEILLEDTVEGPRLRGELK